MRISVRNRNGGEKIHDLSICAGCWKVHGQGDLDLRGLLEESDELELNRFLSLLDDSGDERVDSDVFDSLLDVDEAGWFSGGDTL